MYRELNKKRIIIERRKPYKDNIVEFLKELDTVDVLYTSAKLDGSTITRDMITGMLKGAFYTDVSLMEHAKVQRYREVIEELYNMSRMKIGLSQPVMTHIYSRIMDKPVNDYRDCNPVVYEWDYNPPHPREIIGQLHTLVNWIERDGAEYDIVNPMETSDLQDEPSNFVLRAAYLHNRILEIYPYNEGNSEFARFVMYYYLISKGYPVFELLFSESEYNEAVAEYLASGNIGPFYQGLMQSLMAKMELIMTLTAID
ncbi:MAG: Fic family protein [Clostridiales bacterium]|nr:Fic family protein [Clostridiales bacterium]